VIVGTVKDAFFKEKLPKNIKFTGSVPEDELEYWLQASDMALNPILKGSGVNIKLLDYLGHGLPTISTPTGARGLPLEDGKHILIASIDNFAQAIQRIENNSKLFEKLKKESFLFASANYNWKLISKELESILINLT